MKAASGRGLKQKLTVPLPCPGFKLKRSRVRCECSTGRPLLKPGVRHHTTFCRKVRRLFTSDAPPLSDGQHAVHACYAHRLSRPVGPEDFQLVHAGRLAQTEVQTRV